MTDGSATPLDIIAAMLIESNAPTKLSTAAIATARRGDSARVETVVAIEFAVSWKPFVKSKNNATMITATRVTLFMRRPPTYVFLTTMLAITFAVGPQASRVRQCAP